MACSIYPQHLSATTVHACLSQGFHTKDYFPAFGFTSCSNGQQCRRSAFLGSWFDLDKQSASWKARRGKREKRHGSTLCARMAAELSLDVAIVGGGPGGMAAANAIRIAAPGLTVGVFERADELREIGWTLGMSSNGLSALNAIDPVLFRKVQRLLLDDGPLAVHDTSLKELFSAPSNSGVTQSKQGPEFKPRYIPWYLLQRALAEELPAGWVHLGYAFEGLQQDAEGVHLHFSGQRSVRAKVVIGSDGNQSKVRAQSLADGPPNFLNTAVWRGQCPAPSDWPYDHLFLMGIKDPLPSSTQLFLVVKLREGWLAWQGMAPWEASELSQLLSRSYLDTSATGNPAAAKAERCLSKFGDKWPDLVHQMIRSTDPSRITEHGQFYREPSQCQTWGKGRVTLLGDAAHLMTPFLGQGVNQTLEDAVELGRSFGHHGATEEGLRAYEAARIPHATRVQAGSVEIAKDIFLSGKPNREMAWSKENLWVVDNQPEPLRKVAAAY